MPSHRTDLFDPVDTHANPYDQPTHPELPAVGYGPSYDPGAYTDESATEATSVIPAQVRAEPAAELDPMADPRVAAGWAAREEPGWEDPTWGARSWDRPDYEDEDQQVDYYDDGADDDGYEEEVEDSAPAPSRGRVAALLVPVAVGIAVSVGIGVYARVHTPTGTALNLAGFSSGLAAKTWLTTAAFVLVLVQLWTSMRMYGRLARKPVGPRTGTVHRWSGRVAVLLTIPVAVHCLYALGYEDTSLRVLLHSLAGCFFYGAFAAKMLLLPRRDAPRWALPVFGGLVFVLLTGLFLTSAVWFFRAKGLTF
jgi:hypothetical protein